MMNALDFERLRVLLRKCLDNSEALLSAAKEIQGPGRHHIAYHLAGLALEEIGKASMLLVDTVSARILKDEDNGEEVAKLADSLADHRKKLFWAMLTPSIDAGVISPQDFNILKEIANDIDTLRLSSLCVNVEGAPPAQ